MIICIPGSLIDPFRIGFIADIITSFRPFKLEKRETCITLLLMFHDDTNHKRWRECISGQKYSCFRVVIPNHSKGLRWHCWYVLIEFEQCMTNRWRHVATSSEVRIFCCHKMCVKCRLLRTIGELWSHPWSHPCILITFLDKIIETGELQWSF